MYDNFLQEKNFPLLPVSTQIAKDAMNAPIAIAMPVPLMQEDQARADLYALIARLLLVIPDAGLFDSLAAADAIACEQVDHPLDLAWEKLVLTASIMDVAAARHEFNDLFISISVPKINPYRSLYLTGFINEKPLAVLRTELARLGLARVAGTGEMEDHLGALCETMRLLITGGQGARRQPIACQKQFFETNIGPWHGRCLDDIRAAHGANFYQVVADFAQAFLSIEAEAFEIEEACD